MRACRTSFSYPLGLYEDAEPEYRVTDLKRRLKISSRAGKRIDTTATRFLFVRDEVLLSRIQSAFEAELYSTSRTGHHRYETVLVYQREREVMVLALVRNCARMITSL